MPTFLDNTFRIMLPLSHSESFSKPRDEDTNFLLSLVKLALFIADNHDIVDIVRKKLCLRCRTQWVSSFLHTNYTMVTRKAYPWRQGILNSSTMNGDRSSFSNIKM